MADLVAALGLMSGTSLDGIDVAVIRTDGDAQVEFGPAHTVPYDSVLRDALRALLGRRDSDARLRKVEEQFTDAHGDAIDKLLQDSVSSISQLKIIGFHGQTLSHRPEEGWTWQIGNGQRLANRHGIPVVHDFRRADVANGGQGAPFVPLYHQALAAKLPERPLAILNIGGVANVTWIGRRPDDILAFDTGPGNAPIDDWVLHRMGIARDEGGALAGAGRADRRRVEAMLGRDFFSKKPPKSLDRQDFLSSMADGLSAEDGAATLVAMTVGAVALAREHMPEIPQRWLVTGGGRHNATMMWRLREALGVPVDPVEAVGWRGDALEAEAFAYLAVRSLKGLPLSLPSTTGCRTPTTGGVLWRPDQPAAALRVAKAAER